MKKLSLNIFIKIIFLYYIIYYLIIPVLYENYFSIDSWLYIPYKSNFNELSIYVLVTIIICLIKPIKFNIYDRLIFLKPVIKIITENYFFHLSLNIFFLIILILGVDFSSFRYSSVGLASSGGLVKIYSIIQSISFYVVFYYIFSNSKPFNLIASWTFFRIILIFNLIFSINGNFSAIANFVLISILIYPQTLNFFTSNLKKIISLKNIFILIFVSFTLFISLLVGNSTKMNIPIGDSLNLYSENALNLGPQYVVGSLLSTPYVSFRAAQNFEGELNTNVLEIPFKSLSQRISVLYGEEKQKPKYSSFNRLNFEKITRNIFVKNDFRQGTSPGLLGSFRYLNNFWLAMILFFVYANFIKKRIIRISNTLVKFNFIGILFILFFFFNIYFQSPFDLLNIVDNLFIVLLYMEILYVKTFLEN